MKIEIISREDIASVIGVESLEDRVRGYSIVDDIVVILRSNRYVGKPKELVNLIVDLKKRYSSKRIYLPGLANPYNVATLCLLGVEIVDDVRVELDSFQGFKYTEFGIERSSEDFEKLYEKNSERFLSTVKQLNNIRSITILRNVAEMTSDRWSKCLMRYADINYYDFYEIFYPVRVPRENKVYVDYLESYYRPDVVRFRKRLLERYRKPACTEFMVLLPCSAEKPYEISRTHKRIGKYFRNLKNVGIFHRVVLTSPLGLVPWELQYMYPAAHYDIPVIGYWYREEIDFIVKLLERFAKEYRAIYAYGKDLKFVKEYCDVEHFDDILELTKHLREIESEYDFVEENRLRLEEFSSISSFQFGEVLWEENARVIDNRIIVDGKDFLNYSRDTGMLTLTRFSASCLAERKIYTVSIGDFELEGDLFGPGVVDATPDIRVGDEVAVVDSSGSLKAWGVAKMNYLDMIGRRKGLAVSIRHRVKGNSIDY